ncbi:hypothetical protein RFI_39228 [Reticulomyxa filosa]|uniref:Uncharacterized protein n=1 Tax=Reticulomyxa filosa TaxID=46433 RepID=X6L9S3_RETFI|nr:hypothetical protein RFI_39228 [Reticulomyxa filosa]|eukprot:ETN98283.1 hypothetical protein RFI_39228 [Reticulomyxa filosa]
MSNQPFQNLKKLPIPLWQSQCVPHKNELLICGGYQQRACYFYPNKSNEINNYNQWIPFTDNHNHSITIGRDGNNYLGVRAVIGGINNNLLFITYQLKNVSEFDLNTFQFIKHDTLPTSDCIDYHCFKRINRIIKYCCFVKGQDYQLNIMKIITLFDFINYLFVKVLHHLMHVHMFVSMISSCSLVDMVDIVDIITKVCLWYVSLLSKNEIQYIIQYWIRILKIKFGWIDEFDKIIIKCKAQIKFANRVIFKQISKKILNKIKQLKLKKIKIRMNVKKNECSTTFVRIGIVKTSSVCFYYFSAMKFVLIYSKMNFLYQSQNEGVIKKKIFEIEDYKSINF